jgi:hypothetical protein
MAKGLVTLRNQSISNVNVNLIIVGIFNLLFLGWALMGQHNSSQAVLVPAQAWSKLAEEDAVSYLRESTNIKKMHIVDNDIQFFPDSILQGTPVMFF